MPCGRSILDAWAVFSLQELLDLHIWKYMWEDWHIRTREVEEGLSMAEWLGTALEIWIVLAGGFGKEKHGFVFQSTERVPCFGKHWWCSSDWFGEAAGIGLSHLQSHYKISPFQFPSNTLHHPQGMPVFEVLWLLPPYSCWLTSFCIMQVDMRLMVFHRQWYLVRNEEYFFSHLINFYN